MKFQAIGKYAFGWLWIALLSPCVFAQYDDEDRAPSTYYGHGVYHCYYQHARTGRTYEKTAEDRDEASKYTLLACKQDNSGDEKGCALIDCVFK